MFDPEGPLRASCCRCSGRATTRRRGCARATTSARSTGRRSTTPTTQQAKAAEASRDAFQERLTAAGYGDDHHRDRAGAGPFYYAEDYHQQYLAKNPGGYCGLGGTGVSCPVGAVRQGRRTQPPPPPLLPPPTPSPPPPPPLTHPPPSPPPPGGPMPCRAVRLPQVRSAAPAALARHRPLAARPADQHQRLRRQAGPSSRASSSGTPRTPTSSSSCCRVDPPSGCATGRRARPARRFRGSPRGGRALPQPRRAAGGAHVIEPSHHRSKHRRRSRRRPAPNSSRPPATHRPAGAHARPAVGRRSPAPSLGTAAHAARRADPQVSSLTASWGGSQEWMAVERSGDTGEDHAEPRTSRRGPASTCSPGPLLDRLRPGRGSDEQHRCPLSSSLGATLGFRQRDYFGAQYISALKDGLEEIFGAAGRTSSARRPSGRTYPTPFPGRS